MAITVPPLDNRNYQQILEETLARIPVHTPEWTNFNDADPGITLLQLFAFLTENMLYRANQIPARNRRKFLQLLGMRLRPAAAAQGFVTIENRRGPLKTYTFEKDLEVRAGDVRYQTQQGLAVLPLETRIYYKRKVDETGLDEQTKNLYQRLYYDVMEKQALKGLTYYETTRLPQPTGDGALPAINISEETTDGCLWIALLGRSQDEKTSSRDDNDERWKDVRAAIVGKTLSIGIMPASDKNSMNLKPGRAEEESSGTSLIWEIADPNSPSDDPKYALLSPGGDKGLLRKPGTLEVRLPSKLDNIGVWRFEPGEEGLGDAPPTLAETDLGDRVITWLRMRLPDPTIPARISWVGINAVQVLQQILVKGESVGKGTGEPDQRFFLANRPVQPDTIELYVDGEQWTRIEDILTAAPEIRLPDRRQPRYLLPDESKAFRHPSTAFVLDPESGEVAFGDGEHGRRPPAGLAITASYAYGGGRKGNVGIGTINKSPQLPSGFHICNPLPTWGGDEAEDLATAEKLIPATVRTRDRLVSAKDFYEVTLRTPGVDLARVEILAEKGPKQPDPQNPEDIPEPTELEGRPGAVTVLVIPLVDRLNPDAPQPDRFFLEIVCRYLQPRRLITTELHVTGPKYIDIVVSVGIKVMGGRASAPVINAVKEALKHFLSPLFGGRSGQGWVLENPILPRELEAIVSRVDGVKLVEEDQLLLGKINTDGTISALPRLDLDGVELPNLAKVEVTLGSATSLDQLQWGPSPGGVSEGVTFAAVPVIPEGC